MNIFTINDIKQFLKKFDYTWNGELLSSPRRLATEKDFANNKIIPLVVNINTRASKLEVLVSPTVFEIHDTTPDIFSENTMEDDFSDQWQNFLLKRYGSDYAKLLFAWNSGRCTSLMSDLRKELEILDLKKQQRKEIYVARIAPYEKKMKYLLKIYGEEVSGSYDQ